MSFLGARERLGGLHNRSGCAEAGEIVRVRSAVEVGRDRRPQRRGQEERKDETRRNPERAYLRKGDQWEQPGKHIGEKLAVEVGHAVQDVGDIVFLGDQSFVAPRQNRHGIDVEPARVYRQEMRVSKGVDGGLETWKRSQESRFKTPPDLMALSKRPPMRCSAA